MKNTNKANTATAGGNILRQLVTKGWARVEQGATPKTQAGQRLQNKDAKEWEFVLIGEEDGQAAVVIIGSIYEKARQGESVEKLHSEIIAAYNDFRRTEQRQAAQGVTVRERATATGRERVAAGYTIETTGIAATEATPRGVIWAALGYQGIERAADNGDIEDGKEYTKQEMEKIIKSATIELLGELDSTIYRRGRDYIMPSGALENMNIMELYTEHIKRQMTETSGTYLVDTYSRWGTKPKKTYSLRDLISEAIMYIEILNIRGYRVENIETKKYIEEAESLILQGKTEEELQEEVDMIHKAATITGWAALMLYIPRWNTYQEETRYL